MDKAAAKARDRTWTSGCGSWQVGLGAGRGGHSLLPAREDQAAPGVPTAWTGSWASLPRLTQGRSDRRRGLTASICFSYASFLGGLLGGDDGRTAPEPDPR